jgi:hypothetical protein
LLPITGELKEDVMVFGQQPASRLGAGLRLRNALA